MCAHVRVCLHVVCVCGGQAAGAKGRFSDHLFWIFLETPSTLEDLEADIYLSASLFSAGLGCRTASPSPTQAWSKPREDRGASLHRKL